MAIINNLSASLSQFQINETNSRFINCEGTYNTPDILNGGETYDEENSTQNILSYVFKIKGLKEHTIKNVVVKSLLLTSTGELCDSKRFTFKIDNISKSDTLQTNIESKKIISTTINYSQLVEDNNFELKLSVQNNSNKSCYYGLYGITIELQDIDYSVQLTFNGPKSSRTISSIEVSPLLINKGAIDVTFSKDPSLEFNSNDNIEGRIYFRRYGIYIDNYQYGAVNPASENKQGLVKLSKSSFQTDEDGGIIVPIDSGVAATPQLVFNTLATAKEYVDKLISGVQAPIEIETGEIVDIIDEETGEKIGEELVKKSLQDGFIFSDDFEEKDKKLYIKWIEII